MFRAGYERRLLSHNVHKFACDVNDFANRQSSDKALNIGIGKRRFLDGLTVGIGIDENLTAQFAVYLDDNLISSATSACSSTVGHGASSRSQPKAAANPSSFQIVVVM